MPNNDVNNSAPKSQNKTQQIHFRCTIEEFNNIKKNAANHGLSVSKYLLLQGLNKPLETVDNTASHIQLLNKIQKIGVNLNQIARQLNTYKNDKSFYKSLKLLEEYQNEYTSLMESITMSIDNKMNN